VTDTLDLAEQTAAPERRDALLLSPPPVLTRASWREQLSGGVLLGFVTLAVALTCAGVWVCIRSFASVL
jgi:hypothetical protein